MEHYAKDNKLLTLKGYEHQFARLALFEKMTLDLVGTPLEDIIAIVRWTT